MLRNRCFWTAVITALMLCFVAVSKPPPEEPAEQTRLSTGLFWVLKTHCGPDYDMVILGDSAAYNALAPKIMQKVLPDYRVLNFAFAGGGLNPAMYRAAESKLDPKSRRKVVLLAITPRALTLGAMANPQYVLEKTRPREYLFQQRHPWFVWDLMTPIGRRDVAAWRGTGDDSRDQAYVEHHRDGWVAVSHNHNPTMLLKAYRRYHEKETVAAPLVDALFDQTRTWTAQAVKVFALACPRSPEMAAMEQDVSGFDKASFCDGFGRAGGVWLEPAGRYETVDGIHLDMRDAMRFSRDVAELIRAHVAP